MIKNSRSDEILSIVNASGRMSVAELAEKTYSSASSVRRDLKKLEQMGLLRRHHGWAESVLFLRPPQIIRRNHNQTEKRVLAERAASLVVPNSTIFIDASTTVQYMISHLASVKNLKVYTNGIDTAIKLAEAGICTICTGGELFSESMSYVGLVASATVRRVYFDAMFFSSAGFDDSVISDWSEADTEIRRIVIEQSAKRFFLADHTKRGKHYTHIVCRVNEIDEIISE